MARFFMLSGRIKRKYWSETGEPFNVKGHKYLNKPVALAPAFV